MKEKFYVKKKDQDMSSIGLFLVHILKLPFCSQLIHSLNK